MGEEKRLFRFTLLALFLSLFLVVLAEYDIRYLFSDLNATYRAELEISENLYLKEIYLYEVKENSMFRMLYRYWKAPLLMEGTLDEPYIKVVSVDGEGIPYVKDYRGRVYVKNGDPQAYTLVEDEAYSNEVGLVSIDPFGVGLYRAVYEYNIYPAIRYDTQNTHINLKLADKHIPYRRVEIKINDTLNAIEEIYPHMPRFSVSRSGTLWIIEGEAPRDRLVEVEILMKPAQILGFPKYVTAVKNRTYSANAVYSLTHSILRISKFLLIVYVLGVPFGLILFYRIVGSEKRFAVPKHLSYVPNSKRKPWVVNMLFSGNSTKADDKAFLATILDLWHRGFVDIEIEGEDIRIKNLGKLPEDLYEIKVLSFIEKYSYYGGGAFSTKEIERLADAHVESEDRHSMKRLKEDFDGVFKFEDKKFVELFLSTKGHKLLLRMGVALMLFFIGFLTFLFIASSIYQVYIYDLVVLGLGGMVVSMLPRFLLPPQVFGRWKGDYYKEKLEWEAFSNFLSDMAMMQKYAPQDVKIWKDWLIYAVALGVADKVEEAMDSLKVNVPELGTTRYIRYRLGATYGHIHNSHIALFGSGVSSGIGGGGGFGAGGGFGGGGAGGR